MPLTNAPNVPLSNQALIKKSMKKLMKIETEKLKKLAYLLISASPGGFKIFVLAVIGLISNGQIQGEIANDLAIISFLSLLTAIGAGIQILHLIPKKESEAKIAAEIFKGILLKLNALILPACGLLLVYNTYFSSILNEGFGSVILLFLTSLYWLFRHFFLSRQNLAQLFLMEAISWGVSILGFSYLYITSAPLAQNIIYVLVLSYIASITLPTLTLAKHKANFKYKIFKDAITVGLSNLSSGGIINLAPSICFHIGSAPSAGAIGLIINISSTAITVIRAHLNRTIPEISAAILNREPTEFHILRKFAQNKINKIALLSFFIMQPFMIFIVNESQPNLPLAETLALSILTTAFVYAPQFSAVDSIVINFFGRAGSMLAINIAHATIVGLLTLAFYIASQLSTYSIYIFLSTSITLYILRNLIVKKIVSSEDISKK